MHDIFGPTLIPTGIIHLCSPYASLHYIFKMHVMQIVVHLQRAMHNAYRANTENENLLPHVRTSRGGVHLSHVQIACLYALSVGD
jgi:hypothetical protein